LPVAFLKKQEELSKKHDELGKEIERLQQLVNYQKEEQIRKKQELAIRLNKHRHRENHDAKSMVIAEWLKNKTQFSSAEKAGNYFADWLLNTQKFGREYTPRTITKWILEGAKEYGIKFR
jgi:TolA-binding protein